MDLDLWTSKVKECQHLSEDELQLLCEYFHDLMKLFQTGGHVPETNYVFMMFLVLLAWGFC
uniref:Putative metallo-dependent phosphatase-like protein n=1 Tax=Helianthus annuus TaxID=4232 RepID=A0A251TIQ2_HELAN